MNISARVHELLKARKTGQDVITVEHQQTDGRPPRVSVMIYGYGLAVVTLEQDTHWRILNIEQDHSFRNVSWPMAMVTEPTIDGAVALIEQLLDCTAKQSGTEAA